jgi:hypothetical protein
MNRAVLVLVLASLAACKADDPGFDGIGPWHVGRTPVKDAIRCDPDGSEPDLRWCYLNPELTFAEMRATVDLYFRGTGDDAPLAEILLGIDRCDLERMDKALSSKLGPAPERHGTTFVWRQPKAVIVARMPSAKGECEQHAFDERSAGGEHTAFVLSGRATFFVGLASALVLCAAFAAAAAGSAAARSLGIVAGTGALATLLTATCFLLGKPGDVELDVGAGPALMLLGAVLAAVTGLFLARLGNAPPTSAV